MERFTMESAASPIFIHFGFFGLDNAINALTISWFVTLVLLASFLAVRRRLRLVPRGLQNFYEMTVEFLYDLAETQVGKHTPFFFPLFFYLFIYIFFSNLMGLLPGSMSPTSRVDVNLGMALIVFLSTHFWGIRQKGLAGYFSHFLPPPIRIDPGSPFWLKAMVAVISAGLMVMMPVIHLVGELVKPVSLTLRLFGNIMGKEKILAVSILLMTILWESSPLSKVFSALPFILRVLIVVLGVFVSFIQAFVFMFLSMVYIGGAVQEQEGEPPHRG